jgi:hypothetical protein
MRPGQQRFAGSLIVSDTCRTRCGGQLLSRREGHLCVVATAASTSVGDRGRGSRMCQSWTTAIGRVARPWRMPLQLPHQPRSG